ncbi:hypothetical protein KDD30_08320 [Photobacterium sp. GJ3]|uniref:hypothetical protein n=1 Tax=Photobacterium sp. GJ3 TaxID=2829502 RepID=UPI001B8A9620|nr:hypothetical protein [Photobacterium sp. GJ3]QUJ66202.1 hypothetical protein KDD30_08320 [Photobacterium sp. GJ3]
MPHHAEPEGSMTSDAHHHASGSHDRHAQPPQDNVSGPCKHDKDAHPCCTVLCGTAMVLPAPYRPFNLLSQLALRPTEAVVAAVSTASSLYRPPIA